MTLIFLPCVLNEGMLNIAPSTMLIESCLLSAYKGPGIFIDAGDTAVNESDMIPASQELVSYNRKGSEKRR